MGYSEKYPCLRVARKFAPWLNDEEIEIVRTIRDYMQERVKPRVWELEGANHGRDLDSAWEAIGELAQPLVEMGLQRSAIPTEHGGLGLSLPCRMAITEEMARVDFAFTMEVLKTGWMSAPIFASKNEVVMKLLSEKLCSNDYYVGAVCFTEPQGGVNVEDITLKGRTKSVIARLDGDEYTLNGHYIFPGPSGPPEMFRKGKLKGHAGYVAVANTEADPKKRSWDTIGLFYVPPDASGLEFTKPYMKFGNTVETNRDIFFNDVRIPTEYRLGGPGLDGALYFSSILAGCKLGEASRLVGVASGFLDKVLENLLIREIENRPIREYSLWAAVIGEMYEKIFASRSSYMCALHAVAHPEVYGKMWDQGGTFGMCSAARDVAGRTFRWVADKAMDLHGGYGYCCEFGIEKLYRDGLIAVLGPGGPQRDKLDVALMFYPTDWRGKATD